jgi:hypothetical protein
MTVEELARALHYLVNQGKADYKVIDTNGSEIGGLQLSSDKDEVVLQPEMVHAKSGKQISPETAKLPKSVHIDKNVPLPSKGLRKGFKYKQLLEKMEVGDSFLVKTSSDEETRTEMAFIASLIARLRKQSGKAKNYTRRRVEGGLRVWRTE